MEADSHPSLKTLPEEDVGISNSSGSPAYHSHSLLAILALPVFIPQTKT